MNARWARRKTCHRRCHKGTRGAPGVEFVALAAAWVGERAGARRDMGQCGFDVAETP